VSAPEPAIRPDDRRGDAPGVQLRSCPAQIVEIGARRGRASELELIARSRGLLLPQFGRVVAAAGHLALCVRPDRWLLLSPAAPVAASALAWQVACAGAGSAVDLSSGLAALHLGGPAACELLARGCRLDLDREVFAQGQAAATIIAQVPVTLAALWSGLLLLTPSTTARHLREWLASSAQPFGLALPSDLSVVELLGS
jgi:heterotetrameric sarcosine oxidase gamma subunit